MKQQLAIVLATLTTITLTDCGGCSPAVGAEKSGSIAGLVLKGPVSGATITAFSVDDKGRRDDELGTTKTDDVGAFVVDVAGHSGPTLVCSAGGVYVEESTGGLVQAGPVELCRLIEDFELGAKLEGVILTPWTSLHAELAACFVDLGRETSVTGGSQRAALRLNDFLGAGVDGYDFATTIPADVTTATGLSLSAEAWAGILTAGLSESATAISVANAVAPGVRFTGMSLTDTLRQDVAGGCIFDGSGVGGVALTQVLVDASRAVVEALTSIACDDDDVFALLDGFSKIAQHDDVNDIRAKRRLVLDASGLDAARYGLALKRLATMVRNLPDEVRWSALAAIGEDS